jgi:hypothetical protein
MAEPCGGKTRAGNPCPLPAGWGTQHVGVGRCKMHGGASPNAEVAGQVILARREYQVMGVPLDVHPHDALLECIRIAAGEVQYASERIAELDKAEAVGAVKVLTARPLKMAGGGENPDQRVQEIRVEAPQLHIWIQVRQKAMDRLVTYSATAMKAGLEERLVRIAESQGQLLAQAVHGILTELGVANLPEVPAVVRKHLTLIAGA